MMRIAESNCWDEQEVFGDPSRDESLIFELLDLKTNVADDGSATWFLQDLANEQDAAEGATVIPYFDLQITVCNAIYTQ